MLAVLYANEHGTHDSFRYYVVNEELFSILWLGKEWRGSEILLKILESFPTSWSPLKVFRLAKCAK